MNFLAGINRILRDNGIIRGDDDDITTFSDVAHNATLNLAIIAVQEEVAEVISDRLIPYEYATGSIVTSASAPTYSLASDFIQFFGIPKFTVSGSTRQIFEYPGGLARLEIEVINFETQSGTPNWWYFEPGTTKRVSFYQTPNASETLNYRYEKDVSVTLSTDILPFQNEIEAQTFCAMASRRFKFKFEDAQNVQGVLDQDPSYQGARGRLIRLIKGTNPGSTYGYHYR